MCEFNITDKRQAMGQAALNQCTANHINEPGDAIQMRRSNAFLDMRLLE